MLTNDYMLTNELSWLAWCCAQIIDTHKGVMDGRGGRGGSRRLKIQPRRCAERWTCLCTLALSWDEMGWACLCLYKLERRL